jgi:hypothetical protein
LVELPQANLQLVVNIAKEYTEQLGSGKIIELLESYNSYPGLYLYLGSRIAFRWGLWACWHRLYDVSVALCLRMCPTTPSI